MSSKQVSRLTSVFVIAALPVLLAGCIGGVSTEEFEALEKDFVASASRVRSLKIEKQELQTKALERTLEDVGTLLSINQLMEFPPTVVKLKPNTAAIQMVTKVPTTCSIAHGVTPGYGQISLDDSMSMGGHTDHYHTLRNLQPDTVYHYTWGLLGADGTLYGSTDLTFKTPPAGS